MIIPYGVDVPLDRRPVMNWLLIVFVVAAFALQLHMISQDEESINVYVLDGWELKGMLGHMFLHGGIIHLAGNMLFLWVFGNAVCSKVGNLSYIPVYLFFGLLAGISHQVCMGGPAVGASGAINGIVGMFLVLFPLNDINCVWIISLYARSFSVSSYWMILYWLFFDIVGVVLGGDHVAYFAHLGGFSAGVGMGVFLCRFNLLEMSDDERSLVQIWQQWRQDRSDERMDKEARRAIEQAKVQATDEVHAHQLPEPVTVPKEESIRFVCPCGQRIKVPAEMAGREGKCPHCRHRIVVPIPPVDLTPHY